MSDALYQLGIHTLRKKFVNQVGPSGYMSGNILEKSDAEILEAAAFSYKMKYGALGTNRQMLDELLIKTYFRLLALSSYNSYVNINSVPNHYLVYGSRLTRLEITHGMFCEKFAVDTLSVERVCQYGHKRGGEHGCDCVGLDSKQHSTKVFLGSTARFSQKQGMNVKLNHLREELDSKKKR